MPIRDISNITLRPAAVETWRNWARTETATAEVYRAPSIAEVVAIVVQAESRNRRVRAAGSRWAFDDCARPDHVSVDLSRIPGTLHDAEFLHSNWRAHMRDPSNSLIVTMAGAPLWRINDHLWNRGLSVLTLGGSQGQTLAGAFSTGTHGCDLDIGGVADGIHALHLVGAGGQEYWIERANGVTCASSMCDYEHWDDSIVQIRDDEVFLSALVALGRFGIVVAALMEVTPKYRLREEQTNSSWGDFSVRLENLRRTGDLQSLDDDPQLRAIKINLDPYAAGHGAFGSLVRRWKPNDSGSPPKPVEPSTQGPDALAREWAASLAFADAMVTTPYGNEIFAFAARETFKDRQPPRKVFDRNYCVTSGVPPVGYNYGEYYSGFDRHGPFVVSMEYFFDGRTQDASTFVNDIYREWQGFLGGYIAIRFSRATAALIGPERFDATVIVEVTILQLFKDSEAVRQRVKGLARERGALPHWGQEHLLTAPEVQAHYGKRVSTWRRSLAAVTRTGRSRTFSNRHSWRLGLELTPAVMFSRGGRLRAWLDQDQGLYGSAFHEFGMPHPPTGMRIKGSSGPGVFIDDGGGIHAKRGPFGITDSLVVRRSGETVAEFHADGSLAAVARTRFPQWMR